MTPGDCIDTIEKYTKRHLELRRAHHFLFDLPLGNPTLSTDILVMGLNPGEHARCGYPDCPHFTQETSQFDFHTEYGGGVRDVDWNRHVQYYCGTLQVVQSEFFFWSSRRIGKPFEERFGQSLWKCREHLEFCKTMNLHLIRHRQPKLIIAPGLGAGDRLATMYGLRKTRGPLLAANNHRLVEYYKDSEDRSWLFTKHWSGARGLSSDQRAKIKAAIQDERDVKVATPPPAPISSAS
ncbi:MAG: hypothetical protein RLO80_08365 [Hyphomonas sp.]